MWHEEYTFWLSPFAVAGNVGDKICQQDDLKRLHMLLHYPNDFQDREEIDINRIQKFAVIK